MPQRSPRRSVTIHARGERFELMPERCVHQPSKRLLLAADLHWGKSETFQAHGLAIPSGVIDDDLARLSQVIATSGAERLLILGDLIHAPKGITETVFKTVAHWRTKHPQMVLQVIRGNHDRRFQWPEAWGIEDVGTSLEDDPFLFAHDEPSKTGDRFVWMGHVHPMVELSGGGDRLRLPCFVIDENKGLLPAFSAWTGGVPINTRHDDRRVFAIAETSVIEL